jgi:serine phosphatase RsbU (regulator of sigma subunit)
MSIRKSLICILALICFCYTLTAQRKSKIDSLENLLNTSIADTERVNVLNSLGWEFHNQDPLKGLDYMERSLQLAEKLSFKRGIRSAYTGLGVLNGKQGNYTKALPYLTRSAELCAELGDSLNVGTLNGNIGIVYFHLGNYNKAVEHYLTAMRIYERFRNEDGLSSVYNNLGNLYTQNNNYEKGLEYHFKALETRMKLKNELGIGTSYGNIGNGYEKKKEYKLALEYYQKAIDIQKKLNNEHGLSINYGNVGHIYYVLKDYDKALGYLNEALRLREKQHNQDGISIGKTAIAKVLLAQNKYDEAIIYLKQALAIAKEIKAMDEEKDAAYHLAQAYSGKKDYKTANEVFLLYDSLNEELNRSFNAKQIADMQASFELEKQQNEIAQLKKDADINELTVKSQRIGIILSVVALLSVAIILVFVYRNYKDKKRSNALLVEKNEIIELRNKEVMDSINYAQKIQEAILPGEDDFKKVLPQSFALLKPKDIVSGDFFWIADMGDEIFYAAADCTGHGVPGGFMTMLGSSFLHEIINERNIRQPGMILDQLRDKIITALKQTGASGENKDGMDITLCRLNRNNRSLAFAAANNSLYLVSKGELKEIKADKQPIGYYTDQARPFTQHELRLEPGDMIYTFSDGYADQFGGEKGKKFKYSQLKEVLLANAAKPMEEQKSILKNLIEDWKGNLEQIDDILVVGVRV